MKKPHFSRRRFLGIAGAATALSAVPFHYSFGIITQAKNPVSKFAGVQIGNITNSMAIYHTHGQFSQPDFNLDTLLGFSPSNMLNFDAGHFYGSTGIHPNTILEKYHDRIPSIHIKDKTGPNTNPANTNKPFGQGETPLKDTLTLIRDKKWPINCDIELEYQIPEGSDTVKEIKKCVEYLRNILES